MEFKIRLEKPADYREVERLIYDAFNSENAPQLGQGYVNEHLLAHKLRDSIAFVPALDFVAEAPDGTLIASILYSKARVVAEGGGEAEVLTFGPLSVAAACQKQGVGDALTRHSLAEAKRLGYKAVVIFGHEGYYPRFGFVPAQRYGITTPEGENFDAFMALELYPGALEGVTGKFYVDPLFHIGTEGLDDFNRELFGEGVRKHEG